ncbi:N-acetylmuramoyl-L-alanine amidase [Neobacillus dielmonensis]|uniref:N-acetylmuramoyl-L-alanine amidase n=1 Tax=Neobacillus dielmonensis TaxID=1347369 RepID=UPI0005A949B2|nr:N-acetylmuramoyl-L-alanine amidase [Neobacillus dielmonensis]
MKIYLDPGHGGADPGAQGNGLNEKDITLDIALRLQAILVNNYENVQVRMSRTTDATVSLGQRTNDANTWGADFFLAIHINSAGSSARGYEDYIYNGLSDSSRTARIQQTIHEEVIKTIQLPDRGRKKADFHVLRETKTDAVLTESGFITNPTDAALMSQPQWRQSVAQGHANGLARAFNLQLKTNVAPAPTTSPAQSSQQQPPGSNAGTLFKVISGSFQSRDHADERVSELHSRGINSFVDTTVINGATWYRVQTGAYANRANAESKLTELRNAGFQDAFIVAEKGNTSAPASSTEPAAPTPEPATPVTPEPTEPSTTVPETPTTAAPSADEPMTPVTPSPDNGGSTANNELPVSTILGPTLLSPMQMDQFARQVNPNAPALANFYLTIGEYYGIRGDVAYAQALHETNFFRFTAVVQPGQNNFAGIGATNSNSTGAIFATPEEGVIAHLQHLYAYATTDPMPNRYPLVDPRFHLVARGSAPTWTDLNGKWAVPGTTYGQSILNLYRRMLDSAIGNMQSVRNSITS